MPCRTGRTGRTCPTKRGYGDFAVRTINHPEKAESRPADGNGDFFRPSGWLRRGGLGCFARSLGCSGHEKAPDATPGRRASGSIYGQYVYSSCLPIGLEILLCGQILIQQFLNFRTILIPTAGSNAIFWTHVPLVVLSGGAIFGFCQFIQLFVGHFNLPVIISST